MSGRPYITQRYLKRKPCPRYLYLVLTNGNAYEFPELDQCLIDRKVRGFTAETKVGRIWRVPIKQVLKLPVWKGECYLGTEESGHAIYPIRLLKRWPQIGDLKWRPVK